MSGNLSEPARRVTVVIPVYTMQLGDIDLLSLRQCFAVLGHHDIAVVKPQSLDLSPLAAMIGGDPRLRVEAFDDAYFAGRAGYNRLMLSREFYARFADAQYVFIHQTDVYVFRDELLDWCDCGYDYVGAPWLPATSDISGWNLARRAVYELRRAAGRCLPGFHPINLKYRVGNGGCSLRHVAHSLAAIDRVGDLFADAAARAERHECFEDVVWSVRVNERRPGTLRVAPFDRAVFFSVESHPDMALRLTGGRLPMATHAFARRRNRSFWCRHIAALRQERQ